MRRLASLALMAIFLLATGCMTGLEEARRHTYPPSFNYVADTELQSTMWQLAAGVASLERILGPAGEPSQPERLEIIRVLEQMEVASKALGPEGLPSNHPRLSRGVGVLRESLARAKRDVERDPPDYYRVGSVSGACLACHGD